MSGTGSYYLGRGRRSASRDLLIGADVWAKSIIGVVLGVVGAVWVAQGTGAMHGSVMTGHSQYTALGIVVIVIGLAMILWAYRDRRSRKSQAS